MKISKTALSLGISFSSSLILGGMLTKQANASTTDEVESSQTQTSTSDKETTRTVEFTFKDTDGNDVVDSNGKAFTFSHDYGQDEEIDLSKIADEICTDLNGGYTLDTNSSPVKEGENTYGLVVTPKTLSFQINAQAMADKNNPNTSTNISVTIGKKTEALEFGDSSNKTPMTDLTLNGYGFSYLKYKNGDIIPNTDSDYDNTLTITYDMIPKLEYNTITNFYEISAYYGVPQDQTLTIKHVDINGNKIEGTTDETIVGKYKTGDVIEDPLSIAKEKDVAGYTFVKTTKPFTVSDNNVINLIYTKSDLSYLRVNYTDKKTGKVIYTDYLQGNAGDSVNIRDIQKILNNKQYKMIDPSTVGTYEITKDDESLDIPIEQTTLTIKINQITLNDLEFKSEYVTDYGDYFKMQKISYIDNNLNTVKSAHGESDQDDFTLTQEMLNQMIEQNISVAEMVNYYILGIGSDTLVDDDITDKTATITLEYNFNINSLNIAYQTTDGQSISNVIKDVNDSTDIDSIVDDNLPKGYEFVDPEHHYVSGSAIDGTENLTAQIKKVSNPGNSGGSGGSHNTGDTTPIEETISTHPDSSEINIYDDNGHTTGQTVASNTEFNTDKKLQLNGKTYYRIADNQWISADDVYLYYSNPLDLKTYSDSAKSLVNSTNKDVSDRMLKGDSDWFTDRYTYINDQKYYRVASNEWVNADDVFEYQPIDLVVQPTSNAKLYDDRGNFIKNSPSYSLKTDKISTINGIKMYRVATNQWLPVTDAE